MSDVAYAQYNLSYPQTTPYLTVAEYQDAPTAVDTYNLVAQGTSEDQIIVLTEVIARASSLMDKHCFGAFGSLCATQNTENGQIWGNRLGQLVVHTKYWPILEVDAFSYGTSQQSSASVSPAGNTWIEPARFVVTQGGGTFGLGLNSLGFGGGIGCCPYYCQWTYVNGWPNTTLSASVAAGATSVMLFNTTGVYPGTSLTIYDAPNDEQITVSTSYVPGASVCPLVSPVVYEHLAGISVTNLPGSVKEAAIETVSALVKLRGSGALQVDSIGEVTKLAGGSGGNMASAMAALDSLRTIFVGY